MNRKSISFLLLILTIFTSCSRRNDMEPEIKFETTQGTFVVKLYPETPKHRDNFVKLVESGYYDGVLFHRVIKDFMIQAGDPDSKTAPKNKFLGSGDVPYTIPAEIDYPQHYHKKGALAAAREGDDVNPQRASSGAQFYVVEGHLFNDHQLDSLERSNEKKLEISLYQEMMKAKQDEVKKYRLERNQAKLDELRDSVTKAVQAHIKENPIYKFSKQQREDYKTIGGTPHLDGAYTVFGEVIEGFDVINKISRVKTDKNDRPLDNVRIISATRIK